MSRKPTSQSEPESPGRPPGFFRQFLDFARHNKKWWLTPIIIVLVLALALILLGGSGVAPFIYSVF